ncbi:Ankyrin repeat protein [Globisporangium polare]
MADDMRVKAYPPLPPKGGPRVAIVLPTTGDLCLRSQLPDAFQQQLVIHADAASYRFYARFVVLRKFIVMSSDGDLFTQTVRTSLELQDLPHQQLLPLPSISPWDVVKVLDLVQCFSANASWELVRVRWQSGMVTWLPIELLQRNFGNLLQEFYVSSINSWGFRGRIFAHSIRSFQTEVELWLHHDEFRQFYQYLRRRRAMATTPQLTEHDVKPALSTSAQQNRLVNPAQAPPPITQQQFAATNHNRSQPQQQHIAPPLSAVADSQGRRDSAKSTTSAQQSAPSPTIPQQAVVERSQARVPAPTTSQRAPPAQRSTGKAATARRDAEQIRVRKRVDRIEPAANSSDNEDERSLAREAAANSQGRAADSSNKSKGSESSGALKRFKRLRKKESVEESDEDIVLSAIAPLAQADQPKSSTSPASTPAAATVPTVAGGSASVSRASGAPLLIIDNEDEDPKQDSSVTRIVVGEVRCICGAESVGTYAGRWLHCWKDDCGVWEHADCVGVLGSKDCATRYSCTKCDPAAYRSRLTHALERLTEWLFQCCESKHSVQLLKLLTENASGQEKNKGWRHPKDGVTLLMKAARSGLIKCVRHLVEVAKVDVFATDMSSLNALHHAVLGGRPRSVLFLLSQEPKLLEHQDKKGRTPFHLMLESPTLGDVCLSLLAKDERLAAVSDLETNSPLHYACRVVSKSTAEICRLLLQTQPTLVLERSGDGLLPFHLLCKAASATPSSKLSLTEVAMVVKEIVNLMLDIDVLGSFVSARAPNGWTGLHIAAATGNHELVAFLCSSEFVDVNDSTVDGSETALHIAAKGGFHLSVRTLLRMGAHTTAKDSKGWIPMLHADTAACIQELLSYKVTKQLSRLNRMAAKFELREIVEQWKRRVVVDPTCFDMLNDWCHWDLERIERMDRIFLSDPHVLRLDNKLEYLDKVLFLTLKAPVAKEKVSDETAAAPSPADPASQPRRKGVKFIFSSSNESYWTQFMRMAKQLEPEDFRAPMQFTTDRAPTDDATSGDNFVLKLVLIRLVRTLSVKVPGFLVQRKGTAFEDKTHQPHSEQEQRDKLLDFYVLGELVAHLVLYDVSLSGVLDFSPSFLRCAFALKPRAGETSDPQWLLLGRSFAGGFEHVIPSALNILHPDEFRVLTHGRASMLLSARAVDWERTMDWSAHPHSGETRAWLERLVLELVIEEQQLVLLMLVETYSAIFQQFFLVGDDGLAAAPERLIRVLKYSPTVDEDDDSIASAPNCDALMPHVDHETHTITLPRYSDYSAFRGAMLRLIRHSDQAFRRK